MIQIVFQNCLWKSQIAKCKRFVHFARFQKLWRLQNQNVREKSLLWWYTDRERSFVLCVNIAMQVTSANASLLVMFAWIFDLLPGDLDDAYYSFCHSWSHDTHSRHFDVREVENEWKLPKYVTRHIRCYQFHG